MRAMNRNPDVDQWLDQAGHPQEAMMRRARDIILEADGRVSESIKAIGRMRHPDGYPDAGRALEKIRAEGGRGDDTG